MTEIEKKIEEILFSEKFEVAPEFAGQEPSPFNTTMRSKTKLELKEELVAYVKSLKSPQPKDVERIKVIWNETCKQIVRDFVELLLSREHKNEGEAQLLTNGYVKAKEQQFLAEREGK